MVTGPVASLTLMPMAARRTRVAGDRATGCGRVVPGASADAQADPAGVGRPAVDGVGGDEGAGVVAAGVRPAVEEQGGEGRGGGVGRGGEAVVRHGAAEAAAQDELDVGVVAEQVAADDVVGGVGDGEAVGPEGRAVVGAVREGQRCR